MSMKIIKYPSKENWKQLLQRPVFDNSSLLQTVKAVMNEVKQDGDAAVRKFTQQFDEILLEDFAVSENEICESAA